MSTPMKQQQQQQQQQLVPATPGKTPGRARSRSKTPARTSTAPPAAQQPEMNNSQGEEGIQVAIRMRPLNKTEGNHSRVWKVLPKYSSVAQTTVEGKPLPERIAGRNFFTFDKTFGEECTTAQVYASVAKNIVLSACTGLNGTIFAYGQTSSGKTYTMQGSGTIAEGSEGTGGGGIVHMAAQDVFSHIADSPDRIFLVRASFLEIYNEEVRDLLADNRPLQVREDPRRGVFVHSKEEIVTDFSSLLGILFEGEKSRAFAATAMNERSSRSHTIFRITIESRNKVEDEDAVAAGEHDDGAVRVSTLNLVDLAGSESVRHTGATGDRQKEGGMINQSLLTLSRVIVALGMPNQTHINFRDSKLTRILQPSLSGNARMAVVCCATPSELYLEETRSTLLFASRAKLVKTNAQVNEVLDDRSIIRRLQRELADARRYGGGAAQTEHVKSLEHRAASAGTAAKEAEEKLKRLYESILNNDGAFFGDNVQSAARPNKRHRRLSEGSILTGQATPTKATKLINSVPSTLPRPIKSTMVRVSKVLAPSSELSMLRRALTAKGESMANMKKHIDEVSKQLQLKESELVAANCSNDLLRSDRDKASEQIASLNSDLEILRSEHEAATASHEALVVEKDVGIAEALSKLERELEDRSVLEETVDLLQDDKRSLERQMATIRESKDKEIAALRQQMEEQCAQLERQASENCDLQTANEMHVSNINDLVLQLAAHQEKSEHAAANQDAENTTHRQELVSKHEEMQQLNDKVEALTSEVGQMKAEKYTALTQVDDLAAELQTTKLEMDSLKYANGELESKLSSAVTGVSDLKEQLDATNAELSSAMGTIGDREAELQKITLMYENGEISLKSCKSDLETAQQQGLSLQSALEQAHVGKTQLEEIIASLTERSNTAEVEMNQLKEDLSGMESHVSLLKDEIDRLEKKRESLERDIAAAEDDRCSLTASYEETKESVRSAKIEIKSVTASCQTLEAERLEHLETVASLTEERDLLYSQFQDKIEELSSAKSTSEQLRAGISTLEIDMAAMQLEMQNLVEERNLLSELNADLQSKLSFADTKISIIEGQVQEAERQLAIERQEAQDEAARSTQLMGKAQIKIEGLGVALSHLESEKVNIASKLASVCAERNAIDTRAALLDATLKETERRLNTADAEGGVARNEISNLNVALNAASVKLEGLVIVLSQSESDKEIAALEIANLREMNAASIARIEKLDIEHDERSIELQAQVAALTAERESFVTKSDSTLEDAQTKLDGLLVVLHAAESDKETLAKEIAGLQEQNSVAVARSKELEARLSADTKERDEARQEISTATQLEMQNLVEERNILVEQNADLESKLSRAETKISIIEGQVQEVERQLAIERHAAQEEEARSTQVMGKAQIKIEGLGVALCHLESEKVNIASKLASVCAERSASDTRAALLDATLKETERRLNTVNAEGGVARNEISNLNVALNSASVKLEGLVIVLSQSESDKEIAALEIANLREMNAASIARIEKLDIEHDERSIELQAQVAALTAERESFVTKSDSSLEDAQTKLDGLLVVLHAAESDKETLAKEIAGMYQQNAVAIARSKELDILLDDRTKDLEARLSAVSEDRDEARQEIARSLDTIAAARTKIDQLELTSEQSIAELMASIVTLESEKANMISDIQTCAQERDAARTRALEHQTLLESQDGEIKSLQQNRDQLNPELMSVVAERDILLHAKMAADQRGEDLESRVADFDRLKSELEAVRNLRDVLVVQIEAQKSTANEFEDKLQGALSKLESISQEKVSLEAKLLNESRELKNTRDELLSLHDILESSNDRYNFLQQQKNDLEDEFESKQTMLLQSLSTHENERSQLAADLEKAQSQLGDITYRLDELTIENDELLAKQHLENVSSSYPVRDSELEATRSENIELKLLLASSNRSIEEARDAARTAISQVEEKSQMLEHSYQRLTMLEDALSNSNGLRPCHVPDELKKALDEKQCLNRLLEEERSVRKRSEADLRSQMSDEKRALIQDAEQTMKHLRSELISHEQAAKRSEAEAYEARKMKEELEEEGRRNRDRVIQFESKVAFLENENTRLRRSSNRQDSERESELVALKANLQQAKTDRNDAQAALRDLEKKLDRAHHAKESAEREMSMALEKLKNMNTSGLEDENRRLTTEVEKLRQDVADTRHAIKENLSSADETKQLRAEIDRLRQKLQSKNDRIAKLEESKMTRIQLEAIQKLKNANEAYRQELKGLKEEIEVLRNKLAAHTSDALEDTELTKLRFDKQALENKLRKFAAHCQRLEDERVGIMQVLRSTKPEDEIVDIEKAIVTLCDKLASLEEECDTLAKSQNRALLDRDEVDKLRSQNLVLTSQVTDFQKKIGKLVTSKAKEEEAVASLRVELQELRSLADRARGNAESLETEKIGQLRYLEQENLQLMVDLKAAKKQLNNTKAELSMLRLQSVDPVVLVPAVAAVEEKLPSGREKTGSKRPRTPANKENSKNDTNNPASAKAARTMSSSRGTRRAAGLGEAFAASEENTQDCKQS